MHRQAQCASTIYSGISACMSNCPCHPHDGLRTRYAHSVSVPTFYKFALLVEPCRTPLPPIAPPTPDAFSASPSELSEPQGCWSERNSPVLRCVITFWWGLTEHPFPSDPAAARSHIQPNQPRHRSPWAAAPIRANPRAPRAHPRLLGQNHRHMERPRRDLHL